MREMLSKICRDSVMKRREHRVLWISRMDCRSARLGMVWNTVNDDTIARNALPMPKDVVLEARKSWWGILIR